MSVKSAHKETHRRGPRRFGVNVEIQDHAGESNLWDFLADSGYTCVRTTHPEQSLRRHPAQPGDWQAFGPIEDWSDFQKLRRLVCDNPAADNGPIHWQAYRLSQAIQKSSPTTTSMEVGMQRQ